MPPLAPRSSNVLGRLLAASFSLLVGLTLLGAGLGCVALMRIDAATNEAVSENLVAERLASEVRRLVSVNAERYKAMALSSEPGVQDTLGQDILSAERLYRDLLQQLRARALDPVARQRLEEVQAQEARFVQAVAGLRSAIDTNFTATIQADYQQRFVPAARGLLEAVDRLAGAQRLAIDAAAAGIHRQSAVARMLLLAFGAAAVLASALVWRWLSGRISQPIFFASETAARVASFDLAQDIQGHGRDEAGRLLSALARMQENLRGVVGDVSSSAHALHLAASEMAQGNQDLSQRTEETASSLDRTAVALEQITVNLQDSSRELAAARELASRAADQAVRGGEMVGGLVQRMHGIEKQAQQVSEILSVIDGIAFQTNLLALNAAVEAARAGAHGRGFAVVAAEVRQLAQRSAEAARQVRELLGRSQEAAIAGAALATSVGEAVAGVVQSMQGVAESISKVALSTRSQGTDITDVNDAVARVSDATQQNASLVEQSTAASQRLREEAQALSNLIGRFVLPGNARA